MAEQKSAKHKEQADTGLSEIIKQPGVGTAPALQMGIIKPIGGVVQ